MCQLPPEGLWFKNPVTKQIVGVAFKNVKGRLYPMVGMKSPGGSVIGKFIWRKKAEKRHRDEDDSDKESTT